MTSGIPLIAECEFAGQMKRSQCFKKGMARLIGLNQDLGDDKRGTDYDVVLWTSEAVINRGSMPPEIGIIIVKGRK